jgi:hypothetical protein
MLFDELKRLVDAPAESVTRTSAGSITIPSVADISAAIDCFIDQVNDEVKLGSDEIELRLIPDTDVPNVKPS